MTAADPEAQPPPAHPAIGIVRTAALCVYLVLTVATVLWEPPESITLLTAVASLTFVLLLGRELEGWRGILTFLAITMVVGWICEDIGVHTGDVFGHYHYTDKLGAKIDKVPFIVLLTYFNAGYVALAVGRCIIRSWTVVRGGRLLLLALVGAFLMIGWDASMDPLNSTINGWWIWDRGGNYFGVPLRNYWGWGLTLFVIYSSYLLICAHLWPPRLGAKAASRWLWSQPLAFWAAHGVAVLIVPFGSPEFSPLNAVRPPTAATPEMVVWSLSLVAVLCMIAPIVYAAVSLMDQRGGISQPAAGPTPEGGWGGLLRDPAAPVLVAVVVLYAVVVTALM